MVHDALYQFLPDGLPITRRHADRIFLDLLREYDFAPRWIYWLFVRAFGWIIWRVTRRVRKNKGSVLSRFPGTGGEG
jgi:hypothetical protein